MWVYPTPVFDPGDQFICHPVSLRSSLWAVLTNELERLGLPTSWEQIEPGAATIDEVTAEFQVATDEASIVRCGMPVGEVKWIATEVPSWALLCDGDVYLKASYPELAAVIHPAYDVDATHFAVPDLLLRFPYGSDVPGGEGGEEEHTLTVPEMPSHQHFYSDAGLPETPVLGPGEVPVNALQTASLTTAAGGGEPHNNLPPYHTLIPVIVARGYLPPVAPSLEAGSIMPWPIAAPPTGWLVCAGQAVSRTTYDVLFAVIGETYGPGDGSTTFNLPDLRGRVWMGLDNLGGTSANRVTNPQADQLGGVMGAETHTLGISEMPSHDHGLNRSERASGGQGVSNGPGTNQVTGGAGGGQAHNNMQPSIAGAWIIKT